MLLNKGKFVYAWSFNPEDRAIDKIKESIDNKEDIFLYLPGKHGLSNLRMRIIDFEYNRSCNLCPEKWKDFCIKDLQRANWTHIWFLINEIDDFVKPVDLRNRNTLVPVFLDKYKSWGQNHFAFLKPN
jgi:hypothetical protein